MTPLAISTEFSPPRSAYFCCPKCGDEVFVINEKTVFQDRSILDGNIYFCNICKKQAFFHKGRDYDYAKNFILDSGFDEPLSIG